jgi:hypothetical protein
MQAKHLHGRQSLSHLSASAANFLAAERTRENLAKIPPFSLLSARRSTLRSREAELAALLTEGSVTVNLTQSFVEQRLTETARLAAELLELAERADTASRTSFDDVRGMQALAEACLDAVFRIDAARQELRSSVAADSRQRRRQRHQALRCARHALTTLEQDLAQALSN